MYGSARGNPYRARAYPRAADSSATLAETLDRLVARKAADRHSGVGGVIADIVTKLHQTGTHLEPGDAAQRGGPGRRARTAFRLGTQARESDAALQEPWHLLACRTRGRCQGRPYQEDQGTGRCAADEDPAEPGYREERRRKAARASGSAAGACGGVPACDAAGAQADHCRGQPPARLRAGCRHVDRGGWAELRRPTE